MDWNDSTNPIRLRDSEALHTPEPAGSNTINGKIALIAGEGDFPLLIAEAARSNGTDLVILGIKGFASPKLATLTSEHYWLELGQVGKGIDLLKQCGVTHLMMAGRIHHNNIFQYRHFDWRGMKILAKATTRRADALLQTVCDELAQEGLTVIESSRFLRHLMPHPGLLTPNRPLTPPEQQNVDFGFPIAKVIAAQDIGQSIVVKDRMVVAVEALEGTDLCILRAGELAGPGCVIVKVSKPDQDLRFDIPIIGPGTIKSMIKAEATALAVSSSRSLIFHRDKVIAMAEEANIGIVIIPDNEDVVSHESK